MKDTDHGPSRNKIYKAKRVQSGACRKGNLHHLLHPSTEPDGGTQQMRQQLWLEAENRESQFAKEILWQRR